MEIVELRSILTELNKTFTRGPQEYIKLAKEISSELEDRSL